MGNNGLPSGPHFPTVQWKREGATFVACDTPPVSPTIPQPAALVFPFYGDRVVLADIPSRGWCIPSGHIEPGETPEEAVRRESWEEAGATLGRVVYLGYFVLTDEATGTIRHAPTFIAQVQGLGAIPDGSESRGMQLVGVEDVAGMYFSWDALLAAVFSHADTQKQKQLRTGFSLAEWMKEEDESV